VRLATGFLWEGGSVDVKMPIGANGGTSTASAARRRSRIRRMRSAGDIRGTVTRAGFLACSESGAVVTLIGRARAAEPVMVGTALLDMRALTGLPAGSSPT
jgi:hypothetical protein